MRLIINHDAFDEAVVVRVEGDVDSSNIEELTSYLTTALSTASGHPARLLIVDLQGVSFFGSAGLNAVLDCHEHGTAKGTAVRLVASTPEILRPIEVMKLDNVLELYSSLTEAAAPQTQP